eukprot:1328731-Prymnesium_polylepis.1
MSKGCKLWCRSKAAQKCSARGFLSRSETVECCSSSATGFSSRGTGELGSAPAFVSRGLVWWPVPSNFSSSPSASFAEPPAVALTRGCAY